MKAAIYARVSTEDQHCEMQLDQLGGYCERSGWERVDYIEHMSGKAGVRRPQLEQLLADARLRKFDVVVVWKLDRFGRSLENLLANIRELNDLGIRFVCPDQGIDTDQRSPLGKFLIHILGAFAELERSFIVERVRGGVQAYKDAYKAGRVGKSRQSRSGKNKPHGRPSTIFDRRKVQEMRETGHSERKIAQTLGIAKTLVHNYLKSLTAA